MQVLGGGATATSTKSSGSCETRSSSRSDGGTLESHREKNLTGFVPAIRRKALQQALDTDLLSIGLVATTLFMGSIGFFLWNRAIQLGSVAITTAMSGVTAVVVLAMAMLVKRVAPGLVEERVDRDALAQKALGIVLMGGGVAILSLWG
jgi:drug/metabolite transporter (DMT)-like permease